MASAIDRFILVPDIRERFEIKVDAPAAVVLETVANFDIQSQPVVRLIFRLRDKLMRAPSVAARKPAGLLEEMQGLGWGLLVNDPGRLIVCGASCQPWLADPGFMPIAADEFASYAESNRVKIVWTLEAQPLGPETTRFAQETRAVATDAQARSQFRRYWRWARFGIVSIRLLLLPAIRREAQRQWRARRVDERG